MATGEMTFLQLQEAVKSDRFPESQRGDIKRWLNFRYWWLWTLELWTFTEGEDFVTVTAGSMVVSGLPTDLRTPSVLFDDDGGRLKFLPRDQFNAAYYDSDDLSIGSPEHWTRVGSSIYVGPAADETSTVWKLLYDKEFTPLVEDDDVPTLPVGAHFGLVFGASAAGALLQTDPGSAASFEHDFGIVVEMLRAGYLRDQTGETEQWGADPWQ